MKLQAWKNILNNLRRWIAARSEPPAYRLGSQVFHLERNEPGEVVDIYRPTFFSRDQELRYKFSWIRTRGAIVGIRRVTTIELASKLIVQRD